MGNCHQFYKQACLFKCTQSPVLQQQLYTRLDFPHEKATLLQGLLTDGLQFFSRILFENEHSGLLRNGQFYRKISM